MEGPPTKKSKKSAARDEAPPEATPAAEQHDVPKPQKWEETIAGLVPAIGADRERLVALLVDHPSSITIVHTVLQEMGKHVPDSCTPAEATALTEVLGGVCSTCPANTGLAILAVPIGDMGEGREAAKGLVSALVASACRFPTWTKFAFEKANQLAAANTIDATATLKYIKRAQPMDDAFIEHAIKLAEATDGGITCAVTFA